MSDPDPPSYNRVRKLSFLGFGTDGENKDEVKLDAEMEKVFADPDIESLSTRAATSRKTSLKDGPKGKSTKHTDDSDSQEDRRQHKSSNKNLTKPSKSTEASDISETEDPRKKKRTHHYYNQRKLSLQEYISGGRRLSNTDSISSSRRVSIQPADETLQEVDTEELISQESDESRGPRSNIAKNLRSQEHTLYGRTASKKQYDHSPHEIFVQMDELHGTGDDREWKETARWIKYEESVEEGSDRFGKPHVAPLSFHSLLNLRRCLETGVVLMDLEETDLPGVAYRVVEEMVAEELIEETDRSIVMRALLLKHRHVNDHSHGGFMFGSRRKFSLYNSLQNVSGGGKPKLISTHDLNHETRIDMKVEQTYTASQEDLKHDSILRKIPAGAEGTTVLVGAVDFLKQPTIAFVRLAEAIQIPGVTEVPIPIRFLFILLGPKQVELNYREVGRSIATLMSNPHFHNIAYKADDRRDLLSAINEFLDDSIVLPPGNWQRDDLLPFDEIKAKSEWIRTRKEKALEAKKKLSIADDEKQLLTGAGGGDDGDDDGRKRKGRKEIVGPLEKSNRLFGGIINDMRRRYPQYKSDITDGLNFESLAAILFMYFASLSTSITFGGLSSDKTDNLIGISETLLSSALVGVVFHLVAGQPLTSVGTTGPLILFDGALFMACFQYGFDFLTVRVYVGCWMAVISLVVAAFEGSVYVRLFTRFTQEMFSALITIIYIVETCMKSIRVFQRHPLRESYAYMDMPTPVTESLTIMNENVTSTESSVESLITDSSVESSIANITIAISNATEAMILSTTTESSDLLIPFDGLGLKNQPNTALFCLILTLGTFTLAYYLKKFRNSHFLGRTARRAIGDFGVPIAIAIFVIFDYLIPEVYTEKLSVPEGLTPSDPTRRGWIIPLGGVPNWMPFAAIVPALLVYILVFIETHISELLVDKPERCLKKSSGLHLDIVVLCLMNAVCGFLGMPWHCAATVRSVTHVSSVTIMSRDHAPGDKPYVADVKEQRVTGFVVALAVGLSVNMAPLLRLIPMSVQFGVFLYMGVASMLGVQFFDRLRLMFIPVKYHSSEAYVKRVPTWKMHAFTSVQIAVLCILWTVQSSRYSLAFPFVLACLVPLRQKMEQYFTPRELNALDGAQVNVDPENEPDFYEQTSIPA